MKAIIKHQISSIVWLVISISFLVNLPSKDANAVSKTVTKDSVSSSASAYLNPVNEILTIEASGQTKAHAMVYNSTGTNLWEGVLINDGQKQWAHCNFENLISGIYFVRIVQGDSLTVVRIVKN